MLPHWCPRLCRLPSFDSFLSVPPRFSRCCHPALTINLCLTWRPTDEDFIPCTVAWHAPSRTAVLGSTVSWRNILTTVSACPLKRTPLSFAQNGSIWLYTASPDWAEWKLSKQLDGYHADRITKMSIVARGRPNGEKGKQQSADAQVEAAADDGADGDAEPKTADLLLTCGKDRILLA